MRTYHTPLHIQYFHGLDVLSEHFDSLVSLKTSKSSCLCITLVAVVISQKLLYLVFVGGIFEKIAQRPKSRSLQSSHAGVRMLAPTAEFQIVRITILR